MPLLRALQTLATPSPLAHSLPQPEAHVVTCPPVTACSSSAPTGRCDQVAGPSAASVRGVWSAVPLRICWRLRTNRMPVMPAIQQHWQTWHQPYCPKTRLSGCCKSLASPSNTLQKRLLHRPHLRCVRVAAEGRNPPPLSPTPYCWPLQATGRDASPASEVSGQSLIQTGEPFQAASKQPYF